MKTDFVRTHIGNVISKPRVLGPAVFLAVGAAKTYQDYHTASPDKKSKILLKDSAILLGSLAAFTLVSPATRLFCNTKFVELFLKGANKLVSKFRKPINPTDNAALKKAQRFAENTEHVLKEAIAGTINTFAGVLGAVYSNEFMHKYVFSKPPFLIEESAETSNADKSKNDSRSGFFQNSKVFNNFNYVNNDFAKTTANRMFSTLSDLPDMKLLEKPMIALTGFSVANTKGYHNKLKKTTYELLANTLIPTIFVSAMSLIVQNKKSVIKYPALFAALTTGAMVGTVVADKNKTRIYDTIDNIDMKYIVV